MKEAFFKTRSHILSFSMALMCVVVLFAYQNCSKEVGFEARPSADRSNVNGQGNNPADFNGPIYGGNSDVVIQLNETPGDTVKGNDDGSVDFEVTAPGGSVSNVRCLLDGVEVPCSPKDRIDIPSLDVGEHTFEIIGTNNQGQTGSEIIKWDVYNRIVERTKDIAVTVSEDKVDIIINVDNSGSMEFEQTSMASRVASFMDKFKHLDYNISITTTSPIGGAWGSHLPYVDGKFVQLSDGSYCITKNQHSLSQAQSFIQETVVRDLYLRDGSGNVVKDPNNPSINLAEGNGYERGIFTTYRAFERSMNSSSPEASCLRDNVPKHVILISDETETKIDVFSGNPLNDVHKSNGDNLRQLVSQIFGSSTVFKFHSIIVNPYSSEGATCLSTHGRRVGLDYAQLSLATGGEIGSVCASDYGTQLGQIGQMISDSNLFYALDCVPVSNSGNMGSVIDLSTNLTVGTDYSFSGDKIEFASLLPQGNYRVRYFCYE